MASTSAAPVAAETSSDIDVEAVKLMGQGKRHLVMGEVPAAVNCFQEAAELLGAKYGETATECGEAYFDYGRALLELGRMETGVLGNALEGVPEEEEEEDDDEEQKVEKPDKVTGEEREKISDEVIDAMMKKDEEKDNKEQSEKDDAKDGNKSDKIEESGKSEKDAEKSEKVEEGEKKDEKLDEAKSEEKMEQGDDAEKKETEKSEAKEDKSENEQTEKKDEEKPDSSTAEKKEGETSEAKTEDEEDEEGDDSEAAGGTEGEGSAAESASKEESEDVSNFQLAWEMLELAKLIFGRQEGKENELRVAQCHLKLGEVGLETENYPRSVEDFQSCLDIQVKHLESENRLLAETHYQLGLAHTFNKTFEKAIEHFNAAKKVIEDRLALLTKRTEEAEQGKGKEKASTDDPLVVDQKEMQDLKDLIPDIMAKIEDAEEMKKDMETAAKSAIEAAAAEFGVSSSSGDTAEKKESAPVQNISHLVRKKRKPEEDTKDDTPSADAKKPRSEENGTGDASNCVNGNAKVNGVNGVANTTDKDKDKQEIQTKTVDDVKKPDEAEAAPMETA